jgi:hypothetical protein
MEQLRIKLMTIGVLSAPSEEALDSALKRYSSCLECSMHCLRINKSELELPAMAIRTSV